MEFQVQSLRGLAIVDEDGALLVKFEELKKLMDEKKQASEKRILSSNIFRWLKCRETIVRQVNGKPAFTIQTVISFFLAHSDQYQFCQTVSNEIQRKLLQKSPDSATSSSSVKDIYNAVIHCKCLDTVLLSSLDINESEISTLHDGYKDEFSDAEWKRICFFEFHFMRSHIVDIAGESYESMLLKKTMYLETIQKHSKMADTLCAESRQEIVRRVKRREIAEEDEGICITGKHVHNAKILETDMCNFLQDLNADSSLMCVDCTKSCVHKPGLHVYIEKPAQTDVSDVITCLTSFLEKSHGDSCVEVALFTPGAMEPYTDDDGSKLRFQMRDDVLLGKLNGQTVHIWQKEESDQLDSGDLAKCSACFGSHILKPLSMKSFDIVTEWHLETPLVCQIMLQRFVNPGSMYKLENKETFLTKKFTRLYSVYDSLLNNLNKNHIGIIQNINTNELSMHYQSISSVFNVTSSCGITQSLSKAEQGLKKQAHSEKTYFNTYLKKTPLTYESVCGMKTDNVNLRDCILILMMDNLVRLKKQVDPDPGDSRSIQLCTLPITLKGLPTDSAVTEKWHEEDCCQEEVSCKCKTDRELSKDSMDTNLNMSDLEHEYMNNLQKMLCFGHRGIWTRLIEDNIHLTACKPEVMSLDLSLASLHLDDFEPQTISSTSMEELGDNVAELDVEQMDHGEIVEVANLSLDSITVLESDFSEDDSLLENSFLLQTPDDELSDNELHVVETEHENENYMDHILEHVGFRQFMPPTLLSKHPPPAIGRDDDMKKLKEVLDDILVKTDCINEKSQKILFAPDHKIACNLLKLREMDSRYKVFLPEFPCLHLRKSKITILCSAYKDAGLLHILKYMRDGTFALHEDIMNHCDEVCAIALAERLGGEQGYTLLLAAVKRSLSFSFLNGASSYAAFTTKLLHEYYKCGKYFQGMKHTLFSTPIEGSDVNFALDTQRELDHRDAIKAFRSGSTMASIVPRMSLIDALNEIHVVARNSKSQVKDKGTAESLGLKVTQTDSKYITRIVSLVLRQGGLSTEGDSNVYNVYDETRPSLSCSILDMNTESIGQYLVRKYISQSNLFGCTKADEPDLTQVGGPKDLLQKVKLTKGVTIKRLSVKTPNANKTERQKNEEQRQKLVKREAKKIDCLTSEMNACQALVKPDCSKPKVVKSTGIKKALAATLLQILGQVKGNKEACDKTLEEKNLIYANKKMLPKVLLESVTTATVEFAGVKFKTQSTTGAQYLKHVENGIIMKTKLQLPKLRQMAICEEKYTFTPDDFKSATRNQRQLKKNVSITHLKTSDEILTMNKFDKKTIVSTSEGKHLISTYLARHVHSLKIPEDMLIDIDSEYVISECYCQRDKCVCNRYTHPIRASFSPDATKCEVLENVRQTKGEAEMAQVDWLLEYEPLLKPGEACASIVTSGDIDAVILHMFAIAYLWKRNKNGEEHFQHDVYVILQKPGNSYDVYNITNILCLMENYWCDITIGPKLALVLSMAGNDFLPKLHGISHQKTVETYLKNPEMMSELFNVEMDSDKNEIKIRFNTQPYKELIKALYCPTKLTASQFTYGEIRQMTILPLKSNDAKNFRNPQLWMPPETAVEQLAKNIECLIQYYMTAGFHSAKLPDFLQNGCLRKMTDGTIEYDLGPDSYIHDVRDCLIMDPEMLGNKVRQFQKRRQEDTPQKGQRRKIKPKATSTPRKPPTTN